MENHSAGFVNWFFTVADLALGDRKSESVLFWGSLLLFGTGAIYTTYKLISPNYKFIRPGSKAFKDYIDQQYKIEYNDAGVFFFMEHQFTLTFEDVTRTFKWADIYTVIAYKIDHHTTDSIALQIIFDDSTSFEVTEETAGWYQFLIHLQQQIPSIPKNWKLEIMAPAFEPMTTLLYDKGQRSLEVIMKIE